ncbi:hypothetical protein CTI12_AA548360 [Artemisia annua]|uniref:Ulp1 protease family, C-terminal catalytic domain-containing protein n=1 Tax=Artemisia annua TaxID=35608 RepID=A0A2U1KZ32_ARTAN|nr:hypothetical protein CTI12_AA548360 [Artemisia annua]
MLCDAADESKETDVEDALKTVGSSEFLKEITTSTKGDTGQLSKRRKSVPRSKTTKQIPEYQWRLKKRKVKEGEPADKEFIEVSEDKKKKAYEKRKAAGKRKVNEGEAADNENIHVSEEEEKNREREKPINEELIEVIILEKYLKKRAKMYQTLRPRVTSVPLFEADEIFKSRKEKNGKRDGVWVVDFPIGEIPTKLAFFVINSLQTNTMSLKLPTGEITISSETVKVIFGIPMKERPLERQEGERGFDHPFLAEWKSQFPEDVKWVTTRALSQVILETTNENYMFKMNFLILFATTMGCCDNSSVVKYKVLQNVLEDDNVQDIDWCTYIWECARYSKVDWKKNNKNKEVVYYGPITFLMVNSELLCNYITSNNLSQVIIYVFISHMLYETARVSALHKVCWYGGRRKVPAFKSWNSTLMKKRETLEMNQSNFGQVEVIGEMNEEEQSVQKEELYRMLKERIDNIVSDKEILEQTIDENLKIFEDDDMQKQFKETMSHIFKQPADHFRWLNLQSSSPSTSSSIQAGESSHQKGNDDEDDNGNQGAGQSGQQEGNAKNEDAGNDNEDGNKSEKKDANDGDGTKEATTQKNETGITEDEWADPEVQSKAFQQQHSDDEETRKKDEEKKMQKRKIKPFVYLQSLYIKKKVKVDDKLTNDEKLLGRSIFSMKGEEAETVLSDKDGNMLMIMSIQSLAPCLEGETPLPAELEIKNTKKEDKDKLIFTQYEMFHSLLKLRMKEDLQKMQMEDVDLVFFSIISSDNYYLIVFNIQKGNTVIIDNSELDATYDGKYKDNYELVVRTILYNK